MKKVLLVLCVILTSVTVTQTVDGGFSTKINGNIYEVPLFTNMQSNSGTAGMRTLQFTFNESALSFAPNPTSGNDYELYGGFTDYASKNITRPLPNNVRVNLLTTSNVTPPLIKLTTSQTIIVNLFFNILSQSQSSNLTWKTTSIAPVFLQNPYAIGNWLNTNTILRVENEEEVIPQNSELFQNYPNPFNPNTTIKFSLSKQTQLKINLYNMLGELVQIITEGLYEPGYHKVTLEANDISSGTYIYHLESNEFTQSKKLILLK